MIEKEMRHRRHFLLDSFKKRRSYKFLCAACACASFFRVTGSRSPTCLLDSIVYHRSPAKEHRTDEMLASAPNRVH
ncbi:hypothetical protein PC120_g23333 [Phytophthora cactorum]|nr:hypothetical protein PC120_g23333 [Phytophthora cactorum]